MTNYLDELGPPKLDHKLRCVMEQFTEPVEGQNEGQETAATFGGLRVSDCVVCARKAAILFRWGAGANFHCARTTIVWEEKDG